MTSRHPPSSSPQPAMVRERGVRSRTSLFFLSPLLTSLPHAHPLIKSHTTGLLSLELRWLDPRRPLIAAEPGKAAPTPGPEGLLPYTPYLPLHHSWFLNHGVPLHRLSLVLTSHTEWESTSLVAALGAFIGPPSAPFNSARHSHSSPNLRTNTTPFTHCLRHRPGPLFCARGARQALRPAGPRVQPRHAGGLHYAGLCWHVPPLHPCRAKDAGRAVEVSPT